ncbi:MAG TPA: L,D-transpeptidase [Candidatus Aminicenantes bacterium]|nr:L,D-transpeptidase [Candidatus Aminicenantes bacterium]HRY66269.1 L,D-transpeptidase [Candidatus Aminicenantes bacterium]HRZ73211.1 L,D-transpeptidase [Candidatus Aminicenantes bacterium]
MVIKRLLLAAAALAALGFLAVFGASYFIGLKAASAWPVRIPPIAEKDVAKVEKNVQQIEKRLAGMLPKGLYIVIDTAANRLYLKNGEQVLREAVVSCGSGVVLEEPGGKKRSWVFDTPRGEFSVKNKITNPYWVKPDWAFIEEGEKIPRGMEDRIEAGTLGDYALGFGQGFFIHGTLYTRLLGRNVTHGCVRVGDEDLKFVFKSVSVGTKIYIY